MRNIFLIMIFFLSGYACSSQINSAQENFIPHPSKDFSTVIVSMIEEAKLIGKKDSSAAEKIFMKAIALSKQNKNNYLAGKAYYEMGEMFFHHKNHNRSFGAFMNARSQFSMMDARERRSLYFIRIRPAAILPGQL